MCIIIAKAQGVKLPPYRILQNCARRNPHGFGFATTDRVYHSMDFERFYEQLTKEAETGQAIIIHFRLATHGSVKPSNCHPFRDDKTGVSFAHNGVLWDIKPMRDKTDSETAFRQLYVPLIRQYGIDSDELRYEVATTIGPSRFAFLAPDTNIRLFGNFFEFAGCWYSNPNFL